MSVNSRLNSDKRVVSGFLSSLKRKKKCKRDVFRQWNQWSKGWLIQLDAKKHEDRCGWIFAKLT